MTDPIRYGEHVRAEPGTACILCGDRKLQPYADHCHEHGWVRGDVCPRCNTLMSLIDRHISPLESSLTHPLTLAALITHAGRCPDCKSLGINDLRPPARKARTRQIRPRLDDRPDLVAEVQAYADSLSAETGIPVSFNAAVDVLLRRALKDVGSRP